MMSTFLPHSLDLGDFYSQLSREIAEIVGRQNVQSMRVKNISYTRAVPEVQGDEIPCASFPCFF